MSKSELAKTLGTKEIIVAGIAVVVAASTLVTDFTGFIYLGIGFSLSLIVSFLIHLLLGYSVSKLASKYPKAGTIYNYAKESIGGNKGKYIGLFLGLTFYLGMSFGISAEVNAGAFAIKQLIGSNNSELVFILVLFVLGVIPNLFNVKTSARIAGVLLILMLCIRWFFGLSGFLSENWAYENLTRESIKLGGDFGILTFGLALGIWTFVGIEFCASLAEEVIQPKKMIFKGISVALMIILITSLVMGVGVIGVLPQQDWLIMIQSDLGCNGDCPQLAIAEYMHGKTGFLVMGIGSILATISSVIIVFSAMPRLLFGIIRDGNFKGSGSGFIKRVSKRSHTPINAILITLCIYIIPSLFSQKVDEWVVSAAYLGLFLYGVYHLLNGISIYKKTKNVSSIIFGVFGIVLSALIILIVFYGNHSNYGIKALTVCAFAFIISVLLMNRHNSSNKNQE